jgi:hypothetical protein
MEPPTDRHFADTQFVAPLNPTQSSRGPVASLKSFKERKMKDRRSQTTRILHSTLFITPTLISLVSGVLLTSPSAHRATATTEIGRRGSQTTRSTSSARVVRPALQQASKQSARAAGFLL